MTFYEFIKIKTGMFMDMGAKHKREGLE